LGRARRGLFAGSRMCRMKVKLFAGVQGGL